jgi:hypothetical protein
VAGWPGGRLVLNCDYIAKLQLKLSSAKEENIENLNFQEFFHINIILYDLVHAHNVCQEGEVMSKPGWRTPKL